MAKQRTKSPQPPQLDSLESSGVPPVEVQNTLYTNDIAALAYQLWQDRGCPEGSPEVDWLKAEQRLRQHSVEAASQNREPLLVRGSGA